MHAMAIRPRHVRQQRMRRDSLLDWWLEADGPYTGAISDDLPGDEIKLINKHDIAENLTNQQDYAEHDSTGPNHRLFFNPYAPLLGLQDSSEGRSYNYQPSQGASFTNLSPFQIRRDNRTSRKIVSAMTNLSAQLEESQEAVRVQQKRLDATIRENKYQSQRTTSLLTELAKVKGENQMRKDRSSHHDAKETTSLAEQALWEELMSPDDLEGQTTSDKPLTAGAEVFQAEITLLKKKLRNANIAAALRQEKIEKQKADATVLRERVAQLLDELEKQGTVTAGLSKELTELKSDLERGSDERVRLREELERVGPSSTADYSPRQMPSRGRKQGPTEEVIMYSASELHAKLQRQDATNTSLQTQVGPLLAELESQKEVTEYLHKQVSQLRADLEVTEVEKKQLGEELKRQRVAMVDFHALKNELAQLRRTTEKALKQQEASVKHVRRKVIQREEEVLQRLEEELEIHEGLENQDERRTSFNSPVTTPSEELEKDSYVNEEITPLLEKLDITETTSNDLRNLLSQLAALQEASDESTQRQESFANDLQQSITQLDGTLKTALGQPPDIAEQDPRRQMQAAATQLLLASLLAESDAGYKEKSLQARVTELTAQLAGTQLVDDDNGLSSDQSFIVNMEIHPIEVGYVNSRLFSGFRGQNMFDMDVHLL